MYTTEAQFEEHGITATFKKRAPYPLTETQLSTPLPTVLELNGKRRYLSDIQLVKQELQSLMAFNHARKKIPGTPNTRPPAQSVVPFNRAASCGLLQETSSYSSVRRKMKQGSKAFGAKPLFISESNTLLQPFDGAVSLSASYSSNAILSKDHTTPRLGHRHQFDNSTILPSILTDDSWMQDSPLEHLSLQISNRSYDNLELASVDTPLSQLRACNLDPSDRPEVELGAFVSQTANNTERLNEVTMTSELNTTPFSTQSLADSAPNDRPTEVDLHIRDLSISCNKSTEPSSMTNSQNKIALSRFTPLSGNTTELCSAPLIVQSYILPERQLLQSSSKGATVIPERNARVLKDVDLVDCWTMTTNSDNTLTTKDSILISGLGSELVIGVTEQKLAPTMPHVTLKRPSNHRNKQEGSFRVVRKQQADHFVEESCVSNNSKQLSSNGDCITTQVTEQHDVSSSCVKQPLNSATVTLEHGLLISRVGLESRLESQNQHSKEVVESKAEPTKDSPADGLSSDVIDNTLAPEPLVPLSNDITIYRTKEDGTILEENLDDNQQLESKTDEEGSTYDDKDDTFLNSLNHMRRTYGIENAYSNFGAFLSNVSDFIRDCSVASPNEPPSSLSNDATRRNSLSSLFQIPNNPLLRNQSHLDTEYFTQLHKSKNKKPATTSTLLPKEDITEKLDHLPSTCLQVPASKTSIPADTVVQENEVPDFTIPSVTVEQVQALNLPQLRVVAFPSNATKEGVASHEEHTSLVEISGEKPSIPPLELQPQLPSLIASTRASSPSYISASGGRKSCMQPPNTPHVPECLLISVSSTRSSSKGSQKPCNNSDVHGGNASLPQTVEAEPFKPRLPRFEAGSKNDIAISSAFETLKLIGYTSKGRDNLVSRSSRIQSKSHRASSTSQTLNSFSLIERPGVFLPATQRNTVNEAGVGCDPNRLILSRTALEDLMDMSDSDLSAFHASALPANETRKSLARCVGRRSLEPGQ
ncbi:Hypothetical protein GLP15_5200 [Giardia lamblia P15]|uniref:Uncharacterized protein n=1 Tax=Giardia intestinalis (strain P15) TaxID=658858 RepID=E1EWC9_GIAIA|nr:Hypothetical protein GLP15_5200 [Giardia lamblia P15]